MLATRKDNSTEGGRDNQDREDRVLSASVTEDRQTSEILRETESES